jgi:hypothetical protein
MPTIEDVAHERPPSITAMFDHGPAPEIEIDGGGAGCAQVLVSIASAVALIFASIALIVVAITHKL